MAEEFWGYSRKEDSVGIRNYVAILSAMDTVNPIASKIAELIRGTVLITDIFGRKQAGVNHNTRMKALSGLACNPNIGAVLVVSLHKPSAEELSEKIAAAGQKVQYVSYQNYGGSLRTIEAGAQAALNMVKECSEMKPRLHPVSELKIGVECGGSDFSSGIAGNISVGNAADRLLEAGATIVLSETPEIIGAEQVLAKRAINNTVRKRLLQKVHEMEELAKRSGFSDIRASNPSPDNKLGGLTTLAEKSLGAVLKAGTKPLDGVLDYADPMPEKRGFYFMDTPAPACESMTGLAAGGVQMIIFNTGVGNPIANPVAPTLKTTGNPYTFEKNPADIDIDVSDVITAGTPLDIAGGRVYQEVLRVAGGKKTVSEILRMTQSSVRVYGPSV